MNGTVEPPLAPEVADAKGGLRTGWTTGTCASAAAKAALIGLVTGTAPDEVDVPLPDGRRVTFPVEAPIEPTPPTGVSWSRTRATIPTAPTAPA